MSDTVNISRTASKGEWDKNGVLRWSRDRFLPQLPRPAEVLDYIEIDRLSAAEAFLFTTLKGVVNRRKPRIYTFQGREREENGSWAADLGLRFNPPCDPYRLIGKYADEIAGIVLYDNASPEALHTMNLATVMAGVQSAIAMNAEIFGSDKMRALIDRYHFKVLSDLRGRFTDKLEIYRYMLGAYGDKLTDRVLTGASPSQISWFCRDYAVAIGSPVVFLDPKKEKEASLLGEFFKRMPEGDSVYLGWWPEEGPGVTFAAGYGVPTVPSDYCHNLSVYAGYSEEIAAPPAATELKLGNKLYVAFVMSDGDNLQYDEGRLHQIWHDPLRGSIPMTYTISPALLDVMPKNANWFYKTATAGDCFVSGPSGVGYFYPYTWGTARCAKDPKARSSYVGFKDYLKRSDAYFRAMRLPGLTVWNGWDVTLPEKFCRMYADCMPSISGFTVQEKTEVPLRLYHGKTLAQQISMSYASEYWQFQKRGREIIAAYQNDRSHPHFHVLQGVSWGAMGEFGKYLSLADEMRSLEPNVEFVRFDQLFSLQKEYLTELGAGE